ncbi:hypothetical protein ACU686_23305 [Yinghuangia aomiensis]
MIGLPMIALGMFLLSSLHRGTPLALAGLYMLVLGVGLGLSSQVLVLAIQNDADKDDIGIATSAASFFRLDGRRRRRPSSARSSATGSPRTSRT